MGPEIVMVSDAEKYLRKLPVEDRERVLAKIRDIRKNGLDVSGIVPVKGESGVYRFRIGRIVRVKFRLVDGHFYLVDIDNRDRIYK